MPSQNKKIDDYPILITGSPGFIGANLVMRLLRDLPAGHIISLDNMNDYYDVSLKEYRLAQIEKIAATSSVKHTSGGILRTSCSSMTFSRSTCPKSS